MLRLLMLWMLPALLAAQSSTQTTTIDPPPGADSLFLVRLGVGDAEERPWDGSVRVENGELAALIGYEMRYGDLVHPPDRWEARSRRGYQARKRDLYEQYYQPVTHEILGPSVMVFLRSSAPTRVHIQTAQGAFSFDADSIPATGAEVFLDGAVRVERLALPHLAGRGSSPPPRARRFDHDFPSLAIDPHGAAWIAWQAWDGEADRILAQREAGPVLEAAGPGRDVYRTAAAFDAEGKFWVVWSERVSDNWDLYARHFDGESWSRIERLTTASQPDAQHRLAAGPEGDLHLVWQGWRNGRAAIFYRQYSPEPGWGAGQRVSADDAGNCWEPALALTPGGDVFVAWDQYGPDGYDAVMRPRLAGQWREQRTLAATPRFEAQVSAAADAGGRVWFAWHEAGVNWGKDFGYPRDITLPGEGLYQSRGIHLAVWEQGRLREPAQQLAEALPPDPNNFYELPELAIDGRGQVWCFFRHRTNYEINVPPRVPSHYALWEIYASSFDGERWSAPTLLPYSTGLNDLRMRATTAATGEVVAAWPTDRRNFRDFSTLLPDVFFARLPLAESEVRPRLTEWRSRPVEAPVAHPNEAADVDAIRNYIYEAGGRRYRIYRGDMHRHTEYSWDGYNDGSLQDAYRYAIDAAAFDYLAVTEHIWGAQHEYDWWRQQKAADLYRVGKRFTPLFAFERSVPYPNGHRNIVFSYRGVRHFDIQGHELSPYAGLRLGADSLFAWVRRHNGVSMPHTSGTNMGTNWRDWDAEVEPLVEIYQGDRNNYEAEGAWRAADPSDRRTQHGGYRPDGMVAKAWEKGYRLGVQASSDHMATHTSYAMILAEENTRESLLDAMRQRRAYAATDNILVDFRLVTGEREYLMGADVRIREEPLFRVRLRGTEPIGDVQIVKDNRVVFSLAPESHETVFEYRDNELREGTSFFYVRLRQNGPDRQLAWSSPIWVTR